MTRILTYLDEKMTTRYHGNRRSSRTIYAIIILFALLLSVEHLQFDAVDVIPKIALSGLVFSLAEIFAERIGGIIEKKRRLTKAEIYATYKEGFVMFYLASIPVVAMSLAALNIYSEITAIYISLVIYQIFLIYFGYIAGRLRGSSKVESLLFGLSLAFICFILIILKNAFSHF